MMIKFTSTCFVVFPKPSDPSKQSIKSIITAFKSLIAQLKKTDENATLEKVFFVDNKLTLLVLKNDNPVSHQLEEQVTEKKSDNERYIVADLPNKMLISSVIKTFAKIVSLIENTLLQNEGYAFKRITWSDQILTVEFQKQLEKPISNVGKAISQNKKLLLIDGSNILSTAYFATAYKKKTDLLTTKEGKYTNAVYIMAKKILSLAREYHPSHMAVCWDVSRSTFRRDIFPEYKAHRDELDPALQEQFETAQQLFKKIGIAQFAVKGYEADDLIGSLARKWESETADNVYIVSSDKDLYQLLSKKTSQIIKDSKVITYTTFKDQFEIEPSQWIDVKALQGDSSDNIPGVKGVGEKAALPLIQKYQSIEGLYERLDEIQDSEYKRYYKKLLEGQEMARLSKKLATIITDVSEIQKINVNKLILNINKQEMLKEFQRLEFYSILNEIKQGKYKVS